MRTVFILLLLSLAGQAQLLPKSFSDHEGRKWTILPHHGIIHDSACDDHNCDALTNCVARTVTLRSDMSLKDQQDMIWHELQHVVTKCKEETVESHDLIYDLGPKLAEVVRTNPKLMKFLEAHDLNAPIVEAKQRERRRWGVW